MKTDGRIELADVEDDSIYEGRYISLLNKTDLDIGFLFQNQFNKTSVAFLSGAILFVLMNTAFLMMYITSKMFRKKPNSSYGTKGNSKSDNSEREDKEDDYVYDDDYYDYYYFEDMFYNNSSRKLIDKPR